MSALHPVWLERELLPDLAEHVTARARVLGPGTPSQPLLGLASARGAVVGVRRFDAATMDQAPDLRVIARTGIGVDSVDVDEATRRGILVCNAPAAPTVSTAEHTIALMLAVAKNLALSQARLRAGEPDLYARHAGIELDHATLGLVGFGRIARRVAATARALGMDIVTFDPFLSDVPPDVGVTASLGDLLAEADVVSLHIPLTEQTAGGFGREEFASMKPGAVFVNTARGGLVDHGALIEALDTGRLFGAGLDVTDPEPLPPDHPLLHRDDVMVTPHVASATRAGKRRLFRVAFDQVIQALDGERPPHLINPEAWDHAGRHPEST
jgi:D-3-phosphoglycerate dehydrogenase